MLHNLRHNNKTAIFASILQQCGFTTLTSFQKQVLPVIISGKDLIAETKEAKGVVITFLLPLLLGKFQKNISPSAIILSPSPASIQRIENNYRILKYSNRNMNSFTVLEHKGNPGKDLPLLGKKPCIIVGTPDRIIDHIRRNNIILTDIETLIVDISGLHSQTGFKQNILYIATKLGPKTQIQVFVDNLKQFEGLEEILDHPKKLRCTERKKFDIITKGVSLMNKEKLEQRIQSIIQEIKANPDDITEYRNIFKKNVPIFLRSYFAAKLLMETETSHIRSYKKIPAENMKTVFVSIGRRRKIHPRDLLKLFQKVLDVKSTEIGPIKVLDNYSFVDLDEKLSRKAVDIMNGMDFRGRKISVDFAKKRT